MHRWSLLLPLALLCSCQRDEPIETYRVPKSVASSDMSAPLLAPMGADPQLPEGHPPIGSGSAAAIPPSNRISWKVPSGWEQKPASQMRVGSFLIKGSNGKTADMTVVPLSGEAGSDLANVNRWRGQLGLSDIGEPEMVQTSRTISPAGRKMLLVDYANANQRLMAAIYRRGQDTWFFKMMGDDATVAAAKPAFMQFLESLTFPSGS